MGTFGQKVRDNWSVLFAAAVVAFLALNSLSFSSVVPDVDWSNQSASSDTTAQVVAPPTTAKALATAGSFSFEVAALRIEQHEGGYQALVTLDVTNTGEGIARFYPEQVLISRNGGGAIGPSSNDALVMDVSPHISQIAPLVYDVKATPGAVYTLTYAGTTLFSGPPASVS